MDVGFEGGGLVYLMLRWELGSLEICGGAGGYDAICGCAMTNHLVRVWPSALVAALFLPHQVSSLPQCRRVSKSNQPALCGVPLARLRKSSFQICISCPVTRPHTASPAAYSLQITAYMDPWILPSKHAACASSAKCPVDAAGRCSVCKLWWRWPRV